MEHLESAKVGLRSLQENIDTTTSGGRLVFHLFGALAEFERNLIRERTQAGMIAVSGVVGSGKTFTQRRLQQILKDENCVTVAKSNSVEKHSIKLATRITALYCDLAHDKQVQIPKQGQWRDRELQEMVKKRKRPVALFIDEAHDLNGQTFIGLKPDTGVSSKLIVVVAT